MRWRFKTSHFKIYLGIIAIGIIAGLQFYTSQLVQTLQEKEHRYADLYVKAIEYIGSDQAADNPDLTLITEEIINKIDFPVIVTTSDSIISAHKNIEYDSSLSAQELDALLLRERDAMAEENPPLVLKVGDDILQYVYYGESKTVRLLRVLPLYELLVAAMFILLGYQGFTYFKRHEQANIWVGMSKETAHQLGTPIMSLLGWLELLRAQKDNPVSVASIVDDMENDVQRLNRIAQRFSKIGSRPELTRLDITETVAKAVEYYRRRLPQMGRKIDIAVQGEGPLYVRYNAELFEWVLENLIRNAVDAIEGPVGRIDFHLRASGTSAFIDVTDSGRGIDKRVRKDIFRPGFSTKKRGWGLGLSLSRRIVEDYHGGKIGVLHSDTKRGTTFRIRLPLGASS